LGQAARRRAVEQFSYDLLAKQLAEALAGCDLKTPRGQDRIQRE